MIAFSFRDTDRSHEYWCLHAKVREIFEVLVQVLSVHGYATEITSMVRMADSIPGESNVHSTGRALDCIPKEKELNESLMERIAFSFCNMFPRTDGKDIMLWHSFKGGGLHFHIQVPTTKDYQDLKGFVPKMAVGV